MALDPEFDARNRAATERLRDVAARLSDGKFWLVLLGAFWLLRNLPWPPFAWLAPG